MLIDFRSLSSTAHTHAHQGPHSLAHAGDLLSLSLHAHTRTHTQMTRCASSEVEWIIVNAIQLRIDWMTATTTATGFALHKQMCQFYLSGAIVISGNTILSLIAVWFNVKRTKKCSVVIIIITAAAVVVSAVVFNMFSAFFALFCSFLKATVTNGARKARFRECRTNRKQKCNFVYNI